MFKTRYKFTHIEPRTFTVKSNVDTLTFIPLEEKIMRFLQDGTQIHADDDIGEYDIDQETPYQTPDERAAADAMDAALQCDPTNGYPLEPMEMADLYNAKVSKVNETMQNAKEVGQEIAKQNRKKVLKEAQENHKIEKLANVLKQKPEQ